MTRTTMFSEYQILTRPNLAFLVEMGNEMYIITESIDEKPCAATSHFIGRAEA